jgi:very-short-patch-repair endonuclease
MTRTVKPPLPTATKGSARKLRRHLTDAEQALWYELRSRRSGYKFRRQHPIPPYVADFACVQAKLVVEVDGSQHRDDVDAARTRYLVSQGWAVLRIWAHEVFENREAVLDGIWETARGRTLTPDPSPGGRGENGDPLPEGEGRTGTLSRREGRTGTLSWRERENSAPREREFN